MTTLESNDSNILDAETINWRLIVYPILAALIVVVGGFGYYYYLQNQREQLENSAGDALALAKTPEDMVKVANQFPGTDQGTLALLSAADGSFAKRDFAAAIKDYQQIIQTVTTNADLRDSAQLGLASTLEASGKTNDAINAYLELAQRGAKCPYAPYAYGAVARLYNESGDKDNERKILTELVSLDSDSQFVRQAQSKLKQMTPVKPPPTVPVPATTATNAMPAPAPIPVPAPTTNQK